MGEVEKIVALVAELMFALVAELMFASVLELVFVALMSEWVPAPHMSEVCTVALCEVYIVVVVKDYGVGYQAFHLLVGEAVFA